MLVLLNPYAGGGSAAKKWKRVERRFRRAAGPYTLLHTGCGLRESVTDALRRGEREFVAAGGDGTVNALVSALCEDAGPGELPHLRLGALGLGSSNDFQKPFQPRQAIDGIPAKIEFQDALPRDVGIATLRWNGVETKRFFLINASVGATADANAYFNKPGPLLALLKRIHTPAAIFYAAVRTIARHRNLPLTIASAEIGGFDAAVSNLGIVKNPHFSGSLRYDHAPRYDDGRLTVHLYSALGRAGLLMLLRRLSRGRSSGSRSWSTTAMTLTADRPFAVELDGEVAFAAAASFTILPRHLKVCP